MTIVSGQVNATGTAQILIAALSTGGDASSGGYEESRSVAVTNATGTNVYLGGTTGVSSSTGLLLPTSATVYLVLHPDEQVCVVGATGSTVSYLASGS